MFGPGRVSVVRRSFSAVSDSKTLRPLFRYLLRVVSLPGLASLLLLFALYGVAEHQFTSWHFAVTHVWKPAFPSSWRILFLSLFVVPTFSFFQLLWLAFPHLVPTRHCRDSACSSRPTQGYSTLPRSGSSSLEEVWFPSSREDDGHESGDMRSSRSHSPFQRQTHHRPFSVVWSPRFMFWSAVLCTSLWLGLHYQHPGDVRYLPLIEKANAHPKRAGYANQEKIFVAAMFYNNENVIPYWSDSVIKVIRYLGVDNVFVSILESGSDDQSAALLQRLDDRLGAMHVRRRILIQDKTIAKPNFEGNNRIDFLAALRNRVLEPLVQNGGYDKVIFSNDVFIEPETILELLYTAEGEYDMACGMDFAHFGLYDMWVLRDKRGRLAGDIWPYFFDMEDYEAMRTESPVPVFTCWNGIVVFKADPVLPVHLRSNRTLSTDPLPLSLPATHPAANDPSLRGPSPALTPPIRFRASAPGECFSSESFLLPYDLRRVFNLERIFVNPRVVVGYEWRFYLYFKWFMRHPVLKWWIENMYDGAWMHKAVMVVGDEKRVWQWDGGDCHPWW